MIGFCNDFGFFDWFLGGGRSSNSVVIGGTCKKWTCSTMTSWRKSIEYEEHLFLLLLKLLLFNKKWRSRHCFALHFDFLKNWSIFVTKRQFLITPCFDRFFFFDLFFLLNSRVPVSQPVEQVSSRRGHGTEVASSHFLRNSHCQIFSHVY